MAELFKFRCSTCGKLLGVSPRKVGRPVLCPRCQTELIVPMPGDQAEPADPDDPADGDDAPDLGIDLGFTSPLDIRPAESPTPAAQERPAHEVEAVDFLGKIAATGLPEPDRPPDDLGNDPGPEAEDDAGDPDEELLIATPAEPLVPRTGRAGRAGRPEMVPDRRRDVALPRTAVIAWSLFALLALALSFVAGLMIGHYRWK